MPFAMTEKMSTLSVSCNIELAGFTLEILWQLLRITLGDLVLKQIEKLLRDGLPLRSRPWVDQHSVCNQE